MTLLTDVTGTSLLWTLFMTATVPVVAWFVLDQLKAARLFAKFPQAGNSHGIFGNLTVQVSAEHHKWLLACSNKLGGIWALRVLWKRMLVVTDPVLADEALRNIEDFDKAADLYSLFNVVASKREHATVFSSASDEYWRILRKAYAPAFQSRNLRKSFHHELQVNEELVELLYALGSETRVEVHKLMQRLALDATGRVGFDKDFGLLKAALPGSATGTGSKHADTLELVSGAIYEGELRFLNPLRKPLRLFWPGVRAGERICHQFQESMADLRDELRARGPEWEASDTSIAAHIMRVRDKNGQKLPDDLLAGEIATLFIAAELTTADTIVWAMFLISQHPEVEAKIVAELKNLDLLATDRAVQPRALTYEDIGKLQYLACAIKEAMRMRPSAGDGSFRGVKRQVKLGGYDVPKGTVVWVPFYSLHNSSRNWPDADQYQPERWLDDSSPEGEQDSSGTKEGAKARPFMPFSVGPRNCVGQSMAKMTYTTTLAILYSRFSFQLAHEGGAAAVEAEQHVSLTLQPSKGLYMRCIPRDQISC